MFIKRKTKNQLIAKNLDLECVALTLRISEIKVKIIDIYKLI